VTATQRLGLSSDATQVLVVLTFDGKRSPHTTFSEDSYPFDFSTCFEEGEEGFAAIYRSHTTSILTYITITNSMNPAVWYSSPTSIQHFCINITVKRLLTFI